MRSIDETRLVDETMPKSWVCPHCRKKNRTGDYADEILIENFKYLEHCPRCGYVHAWTLELTEAYKAKVFRTLLRYHVGGKIS